MRDTAIDGLLALGQRNTHAWLSQNSLRVIASPPFADAFSNDIAAAGLSQKQSLPARLIPDMRALTQCSLEREHLLSPAIAHDRSFRFANEGIAVDQCTDHRIQRGVLSGACRDSDA